MTLVLYKWFVHEDFDAAFPPKRCQNISVTAPLQGRLKRVTMRTRTVLSTLRGAIFLMLLSYINIRDPFCQLCRTYCSSHAKKNGLIKEEGGLQNRKSVRQVWRNSNWAEEESVIRIEGRHERSSGRPQVWNSAQRSTHGELLKEIPMTNDIFIAHLSLSYPEDRRQPSSLRLTCTTHCGFIRLRAATSRQNRPKRHT